MIRKTGGDIKVTQANKCFYEQQSSFSKWKAD